MIAETCHFRGTKTCIPSQIYEVKCWKEQALIALINIMNVKYEKGRVQSYCQNAETVISVDLCFEW